MFNFNEYTLKVQGMSPSKLRDFYSEFLRDIETEDDPLVRNEIEQDFLDYWQFDLEQGLI
jgi:hypothetical protein